MAIKNGSWSPITGGNNRGRLRWEITQSPATVSSGTSRVTLRLRVWFQTRYSVSDSTNSFRISGNWSSNKNVSINHGASGGQTLLYNQTINVTPSYAGTLSRRFTASLSGINAIPSIPSVSGSRTISRRPVTAPLAPTGVTATRQSASNIRVNWTRRHSQARPYTNLRVQRRIYRSDGTWGPWASVSGWISGTSTSYTFTSAQANNSYQFRVQARNTAGSASSAGSSAIRTVPNAPTNVKAEKLDNGDIRVTYTRSSPYSGSVEHHIQDNPDGNGWTTIGTVSGSGAYTHSNPDTSVTHRYRVRTRTTATPSLTGAWSSASNTVYLLHAPDPPSALRPDTAQPAGEEVTLSWHHESVDTTSQTEAEIRYRRSSDDSWEDSYEVGSVQELKYTFPNDWDEVQWQVRTKGQHEDYSDWSSTQVTPFVTRPEVTISFPDGSDEVKTSRVKLRWSYSGGDTGSGRSMASFEVRLLDSEGALLDEWTESGSADSFDVPSRMENETEYSLELRARNSAGVWSEWDSVTFLVDFPLPVPVETEAEWDYEAGSVSLEFSMNAEVAAYSWEGDEDDSQSIRLQGEDSYVNVFENPRMSTVEDDDVTVWQNRALTPTGLNGWKPTAGSTLTTRKADVVPEEAPEGMTSVEYETDGDTSDTILAVEHIGSVSDKEGELVTDLGDRERVRFWIMTDYPGTSDLVVTANWFDSSLDEVEVDTDELIGAMVAEEWVAYDHIFDVPEDAEFLRIDAEVVASGQIDAGYNTWISMSIYCGGPEYFDGDYSHDDDLTPMWDNPSGIKYEWAGDHHNSVSRKRVDGDVTAENLAVNPRPSRGVQGYQGNSTTVFDLVEEDGESAIRVSPETPTTNGMYIWPGPVDAQEGKWFAAGVEVKAIDEYSADRFRIVTQGYDGNGTPQEVHRIAIPEGEWERLSVAVEVEDSGGMMRAAFWPENLSGIDGSPEREGFYVRRVMLAYGDTEQEALDLVEEPFDGDTADQDVAWSTSRLVGRKVKGLDAVDGALVRSADWSKSGEYSARLIHNNTGEDPRLVVEDVDDVETALVWRYQDAELDLEGERAGTIYSEDYDIRHEWEGTANNSPSEKISQGLTIARNLFPDPRAVDIGEWRSSSQVSDFNTTPRAGRFDWLQDFETVARFRAAEDSTGTQYVYRTIDAEPGQWYAVRATIQSPGDTTGRLQVQFRGDSGTLYSGGQTVEDPPTEGQDYFHTIQAPEGTTKLWVLIWPPINPPSTEYTYFTGVMVATSDSEEGALEQIEEYFDGGTRSEPEYHLSNAAPDEEGEALLTWTRGASEGDELFLYGGQDVSESVYFDVLTLVEEPYDEGPFSGADGSYAPVDSIDVYRQEGDERPILIAKGLDPETSITDPIPRLGDVTYWTVSVTEEGTESDGPEVVAEYFDPASPTFVNFGDGLKLVRVAYGGTAEDSFELDREREVMAGQRKAIGFIGESQDYEVSFDGRIYPQIAEEGLVSSRDEWVEALEWDGAVCLRLPPYNQSLGRKVFGLLEIDSFSTDKSVEEFSGTVGEIEYDESEIIDPDSYDDEADEDEDVDDSPENEEGE